LKKNSLNSQNSKNFNVKKVDFSFSCFQICALTILKKYNHDI